jgi:flagellar biosynthesis/type III secretory pathway protein FliH
MSEEESFANGYDSGIETGRQQGKQEMLEWMEKEFEKHNGIIVNTFKKEILRKAKKQIGD